MPDQPTGPQPRVTMHRSALVFARTVAARGRRWTTAAAVTAVTAAALVVSTAPGHAQSAGEPATASTGPTTVPGYIVDADGRVVTTSGPSTTLMEVQLPDGATTRPAKRSTTKRRSTSARRTTSVPVSSSASNSASISVTVPVTAAGAASTGVAVGKPTTTRTSGPGVDPTITTLLPPDQVPNSVPEEVWAALRKCESNNRYDINTGNGYYGAYQFAAGTWRKLGYSGLPHQAAPAVQDEAAKRLQAKSGWGQWPACTRKLGLR